MRFRSSLCFVLSHQCFQLMHDVHRKVVQPGSGFPVLLCKGDSRTSSGSGASAALGAGAGSAACGAGVLCGAASGSAGSCAAWPGTQSPAGRAGPAPGAEASWAAAAHFCAPDRRVLPVPHSPAAARPLRAHRQKGGSDNAGSRHLLPTGGGSRLPLHPTAAVQRAERPCHGARSLFQPAP